MRMTKHTPAPLKISYWKDARYADGYSTVITDCRGHGLFESLQKGKNPKVEANACLFIESPVMLSLLTDLLYEIFHSHNHIYKSNSIFLDNTYHT